jgi:hypothetical protein
VGRVFRLWVCACLVGGMGWWWGGWWVVWVVWGGGGVGGVVVWGVWWGGGVVVWGAGAGSPLALEHSKVCTLCDFGHLQFNIKV